MLQPNKDDRTHSYNSTIEEDDMIDAKERYAEEAREKMKKALKDEYNPPELAFQGVALLESKQIWLNKY